MPQNYLLDEMFENEREIYELDYDSKNIDDENYIKQLINISNENTFLT